MINVKLGCQIFVYCFLSECRDSILFTFFNSGTSFYGGFLIFSVLGFMAKNQGVAVQDVAKSGMKFNVLFLSQLYSAHSIHTK